MQEAGERRTPTVASAAKVLAGRYVYCIAPGQESVSLGPVGIEGWKVYTVVHHDICAVVHDCPATPYETGDREVASAWVLSHHRVVETAWNRWGTVLPLTFNTIVVAECGDPEANLRAWLAAERDSLKAKLDALSGRAEYGVQVFCDTSLFAQKVAETNPDFRRLQEEIQSQPRGLAYMLRQKLESALRKAVETKAAEQFQELYGRLCPHADRMQVEKTKKAEGGLRMLMNLSCLVSSKKYPALVVEVDAIARMEGLSARLVGPFPPYSFC